MKGVTTMSKENKKTNETAETRKSIERVKKSMDENIDVLKRLAKK